MAVMRSLIVGAATAGFLTGCLAGPAYAQKQPDKTPMQMDNEIKQKDAEAVDRQYKSTLQKTNRDVVETRVDPWQNMRGTDDPKTNAQRK
jgi:hypothetical protein